MPGKKRYATLPNCDGCGRFTSRPIKSSGSIAGQSFIACYWLLLCPTCHQKHAAEAALEGDESDR